MEEIKKLLKGDIELSCNVMLRNVDFLLHNYVDVVDACYDLINDVIDMAYWLRPSRSLPREERTVIVHKYLMYPMLDLVVFPNAYFIRIALPLGALPQAFYSLRTILEAVAIALYADSKEELKDLAHVQKIEHKSVYHATVFGVKDSLKRVLVEVYGTRKAEEFIEIILSAYEYLSAYIHPVARVKLRTERGVKEHAAGLLRAIALTTTRRGIPPAYGLLIPLEYGPEDLEDLRYLRACIDYVRLSLAIIARAWIRGKPVEDEKAVKEH